MDSNPAPREKEHRSVAAMLNPLRVIAYNRNEFNEVKMDLTWRKPPAHHWYSAKSSGISLQWRRSRALKMALARFRSGHPGGMTFVQGESQASPAPLGSRLNKHKALRLAWACQHRHWTVDDWKHVAWSDESRFQLNRADGYVRVWRKPHESLDPTCQQGTSHAGGGSEMVWDVCSWHDMGPLIRLDTTLIGDRHFRWPPKSPNMNVIECIWDALQRATQKRSPSRLTPTDL
ncbi:transposable element Tcb2 transposase [Trichonephila clavipes]|nr:transposable element Tcb2 transposase [Trichonephila clavipes]